MNTNSIIPNSEACGVQYRPAGQGLQLDEFELPVPEAIVPKGQGVGLKLPSGQ
jgi:hypothetical protein